MAKKKLTEKDFPTNAEEIDVSLDNYPEHNFDEEAVIVGKVVKIKPAKVTRKGQQVDTRFLVIDNGAEEVMVWETKMLEPAFDQIEAGNMVMIRYLGKEKLANGNEARTFQFKVHRDS